MQGPEGTTHRFPWGSQSSLTHTHTLTQAHIPTPTDNQAVHTPSSGNTGSTFKEEGTRNSGKPYREGMGRNESRREKGRGSGEAEQPLSVQAWRRVVSTEQQEDKPHLRNGAGEQLPRL